MRTSARFLTRISLLALVSGLVYCRREAQPAHDTQPKEAASAASAPQQASTPGTAPAAAEVESAPPVASVEPAPEVDLGDWIEVFPYKFKVSGIKRCGGAVADAGDKSYRLGVRVQILPKYDEFFVASRDVRLESEGVILESEIDPKPSPGCTPLLEPRQLRHQQPASGVVVFTIPEEFDARKAVVTYHPTRWGGAPRAEFKMPACFDACDSRKRTKP
jgi:hypothetical protein